MSTEWARELRRNPTEAEKRLWSKLRAAQLLGHSFRRQEPIGGYVVDFVCYGRKLVVEVDGGQHATRQAHDEERTNWLEAQGFRVIRFWNNEVLGNTEGVLESIRIALLDGAATTPTG